MKTMRKGLAVLLAMTLCLSLLPAGALAADGGWDTEITIPANPGMEWGSTTEVSISKDPYSWGGSETYDTEWYNNDPNAAEYTINTAAELAGLAYITNSDTGTYANEQFAGKTIKLGVDIDLQESSVTILDRDYNVNEGLTLKAWTPIGTSSNEFQGTFDGNNYTISGLYMPSSTSTRRYGLFGCADGATIQNLTLEDSYIYCSTDDASIRASGTHVGGILAQGDNDCNISNCTVSARIILYMSNVDSVTASNNDNCTVGGVVGDAGRLPKIENCTFHGMVLGSSVYMGGVVGYAVSAPVSGCTNNGAVANQYFKGSGDSAHTFLFGSTGGILGGAGSGSSIDIENCKNTGQVTGLSGSIGGIAGYLPGEYIGDSTVENCVNTATVNHTTEGSNVTNTGYVGGIAGYTASISFRQCINEGMVAAMDDIHCAGGIVAQATYYGESNTYTIENCYNSGTVYVSKGNNATRYPVCGGIAASSGLYHTIKNCVNTGRILSRSETGSSSLPNYYGTGGIAGWWQGDIEQCWNSGAVTGYLAAGGIVGKGAISQNRARITQNCYNTGAVSSTGTGTTYAGGVVGYDRNGQIIQSCYNAGEVSGSGDVGGVTGYATANKVINCCYLDTAVPTGANTYGAAKSAEDMTGEEWATVFSGFHTDVWGKEDNSVDALFLPHLTALEGEDSEPVQYSKSLKNPLSYPYLPANEVTVTLADKTYDGQAIAVTYTPKDGSTVPEGAAITYTGTTYATDEKNRSYNSSTPPANAGTYTVTIQYSQEVDSVTKYYMGVKSFEIYQAEPKGEVTYTKVGSAGQTLGSLNLAGDFYDVNNQKMDGTLTWDDGDSTTVQASQSYAWTFTPGSYAEGNYKKATGRIIPWYIDVTGVSLNPSILDLHVGDTQKLTATVAPTDATNQNVIWSSGNNKVATVDENGNVTAVGVGTGTITVTTEDGRKEVSCTVTVTKKTAAVSVTQASGVWGAALADPVISVTDEIGNPLEGDCQIQYSGRNGTSYGPSAGKPTQAGNYTVTVTYDDGTYYGTGAADFFVDKSNVSLTLTAQPDSLTGGGDVTLTLTGLPAGETAALSCPDENVTVTKTGENTWTASLPEGEQTYLFTAVYDGSTNYKAADATAVVAVLASSGGESSGDFSSSSYAVLLPGRFTGGAVESSHRYAEKGETVTLSVTPDAGYELDRLTVTNGRGKEIELTDTGNGRYTFPMPGSRVTVAAVFTLMDPVAACLRDETCPMYDFSDLEIGAWYHDGVHYCLENGLMVGIGVSTFAPDATTSRGMIATILWRMAGSPVVNYLMDYDDVDPSAWYGEAVRWADSAGVVTGYGDGTFGPDAPITREQLAVMLYRFAAFRGYDVSAGGMAVREFADYGDISDWALEAMAWAVHTGLLGGKDGNVLDPAGAATRAEVAAVLQRFLENLK